MPYKILSLDGGGSWIIVQLKCLAKMYPNETGRKILNRFDLVVANSGGSIVTAALAADLTPSEALQMITLQENRDAIFDKKPLFKIRKGAEIAPRYRTRSKLKGFKALFEKVSKIPGFAEKYMHELPNLEPAIKTQFLIIGFDYDRTRGVFFRSNWKSRGISANIHQIATEMPKSYERVKLLEAVHASTNAPVSYFDEPAKVQYANENAPNVYHNFWDGAIAGYNNPALAGVTEAVVNGISTTEIEILSIGTANGFLPVALENQNPPMQYESDCLIVKQKIGSQVSDISKMAKSIISDPPDAASFISYVILHPDLQTHTSYVRLNPLIQPIKNNGRWEVPKGYINMTGGNREEALDMFRKIYELDMDATAQDDIRLIELLTDEWLKNNIPNQGIRVDSDFKPIIGYGTYEEGARAWLDRADGGIA
ncbi:MAG: patatin-like phospholipase family protein [Chitinophagales bacterium]|nr:patatin-like phospholipase family protein [Chitinophagales bacterium]